MGKQVLLYPVKFGRQFSNIHQNFKHANPVNSVCYKTLVPSGCLASWFWKHLLQREVVRERLCNSVWKTVTHWLFKLQWKAWGVSPSKAQEHSRQRDSMQEGLWAERNKEFRGTKRSPVCPGKRQGPWSPWSGGRTASAFAAEVLTVHPGSTSAAETREQRDKPWVFRRCLKHQGVTVFHD